MDIYSEKGTKIKFTGCDKHQHGFGSHTGDFTKLVEGEIYIVDRTEVHSMHTKVFLKNIEGCFNSVCFE